MTAELRDVLARALAFDEPGMEDSAEADAILAALRNDPATIAVFAKALHVGCNTGTTQHGVDAHNERAEQLVNDLLGAPHG